MSYAPNTRKRREWGGTQNTSGAGSAINKKSALSAAYAELGKELTSGKLRSIGTYTLGRPIGEGTYGKVRLGTHRLTGVRVAIKQVPKAHSSTLTREIHHHRRLHHPNIMQLYEVLASESYIWMVTELCAGGELYDYLVERGTMPEPEARRIFGQLCMAVAYIHDRGIVHRDLKLENVLLDERCNVKLGDFGFTREFEGKKLMETFCGTTGYAAPEMLAGRRYTGEEVDVWSLGIILYALVCGALPFDDDDDSVMKDKILKGDFELPDVLSEECLDLITNILQQDPTARPTIKDILRHPWFTKTMASMQMETVNEDVHDVQPLESVAESSTSADGRFLTAKSDLLATSPGEIENDEAKKTEERMHKLSSSGLSDTSFFSAQSKSDSESSDKQSNHTQTTSPTSDGGEEEAKVAIGLAEDSKTTSAPLSLKHRNESQTTIKRQASASSDASRIATGTSSKSNSAPLPTHSESSEAGGNTTEDTFTPMMLFSSPLEKRPSQSSSRGGHHRTPSRTKRRSSGGLSDHHPPSLDLKPVDYIALLELSTPATFSTILEQNLLHQLSGLGMDVGQIVHSVVNEACDASGAMWWILKKKAEEKLQQEHDQGISPYMTTYTLAHAPISATNPATGTEYERSRNDSNVSDYRYSDKSSGAIKTSPLLQPRELVRPTAMKPEKGQIPPLGNLNTEADNIRTFDIPQRDSSNVLSEGPLSDITHGPVASQHANAALRQPRPSPQRNRASSFSARLTQVLAGKDKEMRNENVESSIMIGNEQIPIEERSKSPVMPGFFSKKTERNSPSPASTPKNDKKKDFKSPLRPEATGSVSSHSKSEAKEAKRSASREEKHEQGSPGGSPIRKGKGKAENLTDKSDLKATKSFETFSTISSNSHHTDGTHDNSTTKGKGTRSSFLHTVRNWLGTDDKSGNGSSNRTGTTKKKKKRQQQQQQQQQQLQLSTKMSTSGSQRQMHSPVNVKRLSSTQGLRPASPAMMRNGSLRRQPPVAYPTTSVARSPRLSQRGSLSRRSSSGSVQYATLTQRPLNPRRPSAGSITPTTVGPGIEDFLLPIRSSRPSSAQSHTRPLGTMHAKSGSTGSSNSFARMQSHGSGYSGSLRGIHARRPSVDGGTTVRRHRHYPHHHSRSDSMSRSRPSTPNRNSIVEDVSMDTITPRRSLDIDVGRSSPLHTPRASQSVFVAHRSRTPYKPPSANPSLHLYEERDSGHGSHNNITQGRLFYHGFQPPTAFGTWRRSWGKPPPSWAGPVDQQSSTDEKKGETGRTSTNNEENQFNAKTFSIKPTLRDVFANRESDDDWEDEDDEPTYAGGLGQLASSSWVPDPSMSSLNSTIQQPGTPISKRTEGMPNNLLNSGRYAGVRSIFQTPSLGRDTMPRTWIMSGNEDSKENENGIGTIPSSDTNAKDIISSSPIRRPINLMNTNANNTVNPTTTTNTSSATANTEATKDNTIATTSLSNTASRVRSTAPTFKGPVTIEEEEEDE